MIDDIMKQLEALGTAQNRKIYKRHGSGDNVFGVSFKDLRGMGKKIKVNHELALELWDSGNADARILACMIADPKKISKDTLNSWVNEIDYYVLSDEFAKSLVFRTPFAEEMMMNWMDSKKEYVARAGWTILSLLVLDMKDTRPDSYYTGYLKRIEKDIHTSKNRTKQAMNNTLISIGIRNKALRDLSLSSADRIGKVDVDVGQTYCKIPVAREYIEKTWKRKR
jgi:3-methyladenine DNA glycosylase AlkD